MFDDYAVPKNQIRKKNIFSDFEKIIIIFQNRILDQKNRVFKNEIFSIFCRDFVLRFFWKIFFHFGRKNIFLDFEFFLKDTTSM